MKYVVNRQLSPGCAIVTLNLDGFGKVQVGNLAMDNPELVKAYKEALQGYLGLSQGYCQYYAAERLVRRFGGNIEKMEIGENVGATM
ncbi:hypothetical protein [Desulfogranum marinum]|uniref:hypothetical protein n=1 Tax=Desulfogranum marinum TaxID=453220 RepID=UPI0019649352|nr:hypothetical protein [Desulfogranum marinum]MBM9514205.1 hypothetical protein [Desulfogranum marinum]